MCSGKLPVWELFVIFARNLVKGMIYLLDIMSYEDSTFFNFFKKQKYVESKTAFKVLGCPKDFEKHNRLIFKRKKNIKIVIADSEWCFYKMMRFKSEEEYKKFNEELKELSLQRERNIFQQYSSSSELTKLSYIVEDYAEDARIHNSDYVYPIFKERLQKYLPEYERLIKNNEDTFSDSKKFLHSYILDRARFVLKMHDIKPIIK